MTRLNIRWKLTLWNTAAFTLVLAVFGGLVYYWLREMHLDVVVARLQRELSAVSEDLDPTSIHQWARRAEQNPELRTVIWNANKQLVAGDAEFASALPVNLRSEPTAFTTVGLTGLGRFAIATEEVNDHFVLLAMDLHHVDEEMDQVRRALTVTLPCALAVASILAYVLAKRTLAPVDNIRRQAEAITAARLDERVPVTNPHDELGQLARTLNDMIARLQRSFEEVRRFTADASHELRTPLAIIRSDAEIGLSANGCEVQTRTRFESILEETQRLTHLTEQLLHLCREESGDSQRGYHALDFGELIADTVHAMRSIEESRQLIFDVSTRSGALVRGDEKQLRRVLVNLIENAIKYSPPNGMIKVNVDVGEHAVVVGIQDSGPGIPADLHTRVFDRFFRGNQDADASFQGSGLGLSIAKAIIESHGGSIELQAFSPLPARFCVTLPLTPVQELPIVNRRKAI